MPMRRTSTTDRDLESYRSEFPVLERKAYLISASLGSGLGSVAPVPGRVPRRVGDQGRPRSRLVRGHLPEDARPEDLVRAPRRLRRGRARDHDEHLDRDLDDRLGARVRGPEQGRDVRAGFPHRRARLARERQARRRDRVAPFTRRAHDPPRGVRPGDRRTHGGRHGQPRALPLERDRRREGGLPDRARARRALVPGRLPRDRHRAARPSRRRLRRLRGRRPEVALRRSGSRVPVRPAGADPLARAGGDGMVRDGRAVLVRHAAPRVPPDRSPLRARDATRARCSSSRRGDSTSSAR